VIVPALVDYYERLATDPNSDVSPYGWSRQKVGFVIVLNADGSLHAIDPPPAVDAASTRHFTLIVPGQSKPSGSGINPCFLWDNLTYTLGVVPENRNKDWAWKRFEKFRSEHLALEDAINEPAFSAVCSFLRSWSPATVSEHAQEVERASGFGVFRIRTAHEYVHETDAVIRYWNGRIGKVGADPVEAPSLVTGGIEPLARLHEPKIKGVRGSQSSGALLASFNLDAFESYSKEQGLNAPIGEQDAFRYCTALNKLLADGRRRVQVGDATTVFWSEKPHPVEDITGYVIGGVEDEDSVRRVEAFLTSLRQGIGDATIEESETRFFVLGLAPNAARISVRFWLDGTVGTFADRLARHSAALELGGAPDGYVFPSIRRLGAETAPPKSGWPDEERVPPVLAGEMARAVLGGLPYPRSLFTRVVERIRAEGFANPEKRKDWRPAMHRRASIVKACLVAGAPGSRREIPVSLKEDHPEVAYQLGRLFAVLEKAQEEAFDGKLNASIRDRYLGAASGTPSTVFPRLLRLHTHHLRKLESVGRRVNLERLVSSICSRVDSTAGFPSHLPIEGQGLFFLGYYQQRQDLYTSKKTADAVTADA
jgi:CRISPR-associated protein Csd1